MFRKAKYVVLKEWGMVGLTPFIFPDYINHASFVRMLGKVTEDVDSAGFVSFDTLNGIHCSGESESLGKECNHPRDSKLISRMMCDD